MKIAGLEKCSFVDYPGRMAAVFFTATCNWRCYYCHNRAIVDAQSSAGALDVETALAWLDGRRGFLDAVVISGGEPTLQPGLIDFIRTVRAKGFLVKLDTNGTRPEVLAELLEQNLLDYVAMDLKAPLDKYEAICGVPVDHRAVNKSIDRLLNGSVDYEFRTTVVPVLTPGDILAIARRIRGARRYILQQYRRPAGAANDPRFALSAHAPTWPHPILESLETIVRHCELRGFESPAHTHAASAA